MRPVQPSRFPRTPSRFLPGKPHRAAPARLAAIGALAIGALAIADTASASAASEDLVEKAAPAILDAADSASCILASRIPTSGMLLPLGPELFVTPTGEVGVGTTTPQHSLDVVGDVRADARVAFGNDARIGADPNYDRIFDFSHVLTDFSSAQSWTPLRSYFRLDPSIDLTGPDAKYFYSQDFIIRTSAGNDNDIEYLQGPYMLALHEGGGTLNLMAGALLGAENNNGLVNLQVAAYNVSLADWGAVTIENSAAEFRSGHWGTTGSIENDYGLYVWTPYTDGTVMNHYGLYLEDQDRGEEDSYAIYSAGGTCYLAGDLGVGTDTPGAKLDVAGDFVASGTKSFVEPHPTDPTREIRFVCLEGNEAGTYFRGWGRLENGEAVIEVPEDFALVTELRGLTVQLTPRGPGADLWVAEDGLERIVVRGARDVEFDYLVNGVRRGYADFQTIRPRERGPSNASTRVRSPEREAAQSDFTRRLREDR